MATTRNIQMQYYNGTDYDVLYPMANYQNMVGTPPGISGDLSFSDISGTVSTSQLPTVPINKGGTGATSAASARSNLGITPGNIGAAASSHNHNASNITSGTLPLTRGGTGATSASGANGNIVYGSSTLTSLSTSYYLPVASSSSNGYKVSMTTLGNYIMNTFGGSSSALTYSSGSYIGTGSTSRVTINTSITPLLLFVFGESLGNIKAYQRLLLSGTSAETDEVFYDKWFMAVNISLIEECVTNRVEFTSKFGDAYVGVFDFEFSGSQVTWSNPSEEVFDEDDNSVTSTSSRNLSRAMLNDDGDNYYWLAIGF